MRSYTKINLAGGHLITGPRPPFKDLKDHAIPADVIVTLLKATERHCQLYGTTATEAGYAWANFPMSAWSILWERQDIETECRQVLGWLAEGKTVFVHCSAGIHRSTSFALNCMRLAGLDYPTARAIIRRVRPDLTEHLAFKGGEEL